MNDRRTIMNDSITTIPIISLSSMFEDIPDASATLVDLDLGEPVYPNYC